MGRRVWYSRSVCSRSIVWFGWRGGSVHGGLGHLPVNMKNENGEKCPKSKTNIIYNYSPEFILIFTILNLSTSTYIIV